MKLRIHFTREGVEDYYEVEADTLAGVRSRNEAEIARRGLNYIENSMWSERLD